jgi:nucleotide-binding universal stress UspA family protein
MDETITLLEPRIAFGDDRSPGADVAWQWITAQSWPGWTVDVIRVTEPDPSIQALFTHEPLHEEAPADPRIAPDQTGLAAVRHLTTAYDARVILCEQRSVALTVVGARGRGLLKSMRIGSTAEWLMRCPAGPLLVARLVTPVQRVLVCVDGSAHADAAVEALLRMPWVAGTEVTVLAVSESHDLGAEQARRSAARLGAAGARVDVAVVEPDPLAITINPTASILFALDSRKPDLVVLGTKGRTGLSRVFVGSVAGAVAHAAECSVLLARDRDEDDSTDG